MSEVTLDDGLFAFVPPSISSIEVATPLNRGLQRAPQPSHHADAMLWGFDERAESARYERIQSRLIRLEAALFEEFGARLDANSKDCLLRIIVGYPSVAAPLISCEPDGVLTATWRAGQTDELAIKCVSRAKLHYSIISTSAVNPAQVDRQWGTFHNAALFFTENALARRIAG